MNIKLNKNEIRKRFFNSLYTVFINDTLSTQQTFRQLIKKDIKFNELLEEKFKVLNLNYYYEPFLLNMIYEITNGGVSDFTKLVFSGKEKKINLILRNCLLNSRDKLTNTLINEDKYLFKEIDNANFFYLNKKLIHKIRYIDINYRALYDKYLEVFFNITKLPNSRKELDLAFLTISDIGKQYAMEIYKKNDPNPKHIEEYKEFLEIDAKGDLANLRTQYHQKNSLVPAAFLAILNHPDFTDPELLLYFFEKHVLEFYKFFKWEIYDLNSNILHIVLENYIDCITMIIANFDYSLIINLEMNLLVELDYKSLFSIELVNQEIRSIFGDKVELFSGLVRVFNDALPYIKTNRPDFYDEYILLVSIIGIACKQEDPLIDLIIRNIHTFSIDRLISPKILLIIFYLIKNTSMIENSNILLTKINNIINELSSFSIEKRYYLYLITATLLNYCRIKSDKFPTNNITKEIYNLIIDNRKHFEMYEEALREGDMIVDNDIHFIVFAFKKLADMNTMYCDNAIDQSMVKQSKKLFNLIRENVLFSVFYKVEPYVKQLQLEAEYYLFKNRKQLIMTKYNSIISLRNAVEDDEEYYEKVGEMLHKLAAEILDESDDIDEFLRNYELSFFSYLKNSNNIESLFEGISESFRKDVYKAVRTSNIVYETLLSHYNNEDSIDFSAAIIPLTKILENYGDRLMISVSDNLEKYNDMNKGISKMVNDFVYNEQETTENRKKVFVTLNNLKEMLSINKMVYFNSLSETDGFIIEDLKKVYNNQKISKNSDPNALCDNRGSFFELGLDSVVNIEKLKDLKGMKIKSCSSAYHPHDLFKDDFPTYESFDGTLEFSDDDVHNRYLLVGAINYIRLNFRNRVAHKDQMTKDEAKQCQEMIIVTQKILWILLYITQGI